MFSLIGILAFTPCVFSMVPIISSIIVKHDKTSVLVSSLYVLGIGLCYSTIGIILSLFNFNIQSSITKYIFLNIDFYFYFYISINYVWIY